MKVNPWPESQVSTALSCNLHESILSLLRDYAKITGAPLGCNVVEWYASRHEDWIGYKSEIGRLR